MNTTKKRPESGMKIIMSLDVEIRSWRNTAENECRFRISKMYYV
jgi:hypothetical protein